jgi:alkylation response protein AidB-like acyl-CoA dehydrogenase
MDFELNEVQAMLADSIEKFVVNDYDFETRQKYAGSETGYNKDVWQTFAELGWTAVPFSENDGGFDGGPVEMMVVMERLGRGLVVEPYLANVVLAGGVLKRAASDAQKADWLQPMIAGELQATVAFVERPARYQVSNVRTSATKDGDSWVINGTKGYVLNGDTAELLIVPVRTSGDRSAQDGITLFGVAADSEGVSIRGYETVDGHRAAEVSLHDVSVSAASVIGNVGEGYAALAGAISDATLAVCAEGVGIMTALTEKTIEYAKSRVQFGVPISSFQALQHRMVEMYTACEQSRSLMMWAAMTIAGDDDEESARAVHSLKYQIGSAGTRIGEEAVQIHGGMGVTWDLDVAHYFKRLTAINIMFGNADWHLDRLATASDS